MNTDGITSHNNQLDTQHLGNAVHQVGQHCGGDARRGNAALRGNAVPYGDAALRGNAVPRPSLLLHACCGPCSLEPTRLLQEQGFSPTIFYANSNIAPADEYARRGETLLAWAASQGLPTAEGVYDSAAWEATAGAIGQAALQEVLDADAAANADAASVVAAGTAEPGAEPAVGATPRAAILRIDPAKRQARCRACYRLRLEEAARYAADHGFEALGTTLSVSVYQYTDIIQQELQRACEAAGLTPVFEDFRPYFDEAERRSKELGMYRQNYCGCRFSNLEAQAERAERREARKAAKAAERAAHAAETAAADAAARAKREEKQAYAEKQRRKRELLRAMRKQGPAQ